MQDMLSAALLMLHVLNIKAFIVLYLFQGKSNLGSMVYFVSSVNLGILQVLY